MSLQEYVTRAGGRAVDEFEWGEIEWLDSAELTDSDALTVGRVTIDAGASNPEHYHANCDETLYMLEGTLEHSIGEEATTLEAGDCLHIPQGEPHAAENPGDEPAVAVISYDTGQREFAPVE